MSAHPIVDSVKVSLPCVHLKQRPTQLMHIAGSKVANLLGVGLRLRLD